MLDDWLQTHFRPGPARRWRRWRVGQGQLVLGHSGISLLVPHSTAGRYSNAQIDDYAGLQRRDYPWRPPVTLQLRARWGGELRGTAGFGFWNHPFAPDTGLGALPRALWFFRASAETNLPIAADVPGSGWKAAALDLLTPRALRWAPLAPPVVLLNQLPALQRRIWPRIQRDLAIREAALPDPGTAWHDYQIRWQPDGAQLLVDDAVVLETDRPPRGPLGFIAWVDTQYAVATPRGRLGWGILDVAQPQWLEIAALRIEGR